MIVYRISLKPPFKLQVFRGYKTAFIYYPGIAVYYTSQHKLLNFLAE